MIDKKKIELAITDILQAIGEDYSREGLLDTPKRVANMCEDIFCGTGDDPKKYIKTFKESIVSEEIIIVKDIPVHSMCEHHMMPFVGKVSIAYIPNDNVVMGLSKFARIVESFSKRLQIQERLTSQICGFVSDELKTKGVAVLISAEHMCMVMRGVKSIGAVTNTMSFRGVFENDDKRRLEVISLLKD